MTNLNNWFEEYRSSKSFLQLKERPIAYFCAEFALSSDSPTYAGGLGVLASDTISEAIDQQIPFVAVGMFYEEGYLHHEIHPDGTLLKHPSRTIPSKFGFQEVLNSDKSTFIITVPLQGRLLKVRAFEKSLGTVRIFLLDTDLPENDTEDRNINNRLYVSNKETRFKQQMVLGIAGIRLLDALKIHPILYHMNEGHSALLTFEVAHHEMNEYKRSYLEELKRTKQHILFTNHTLLAVGNDTFNNDMVSALLSDYSSQLQIPVNEMISLGLVKDSGIFSMTLLAMRMAASINAVSKLHARKAVEIWPDHPMSAVTNGIHIPTWDKIGDQNSEIKDLSSNENNIVSHKLTADNFWLKHQKNKSELLEIIENKTGKVWDENHLLFGWARRMVPYKRPLALFRDKERLLRLAKDTLRPIRIIIAGSAHENDTEGARMLGDIRELINSELGQFISYLPDYNKDLAKFMVSGSDVWLNTPIVGFEACGTSAMKACLNGVLPCTTKDGWLEEVELYGVGWSLDSDNITDSLLTTIEHQIVPMYYFKDKQGIPGAWIENMKNARELILNDFSTTRMLKEYITLMYEPTITALNS